MEIKDSVFRNEVSELFNNGSCKEREHNFMVAGDREPFATVLGWTTNDIRVRPIVLNKVHVDCGKVLEPESEISNERHCFEKNFRKKNSRPEVQVHAALKL